jgi:hypothetical protein
LEVAIVLGLVVPEVEVEEQLPGLVFLEFLGLIVLFLLQPWKAYPEYSLVLVSVLLLNS